MRSMPQGLRMGVAWEVKVQRRDGGAKQKGGGGGGEGQPEFIKSAHISQQL